MVVMRKEELLDRLQERLARGEISEKTYLDIKGRVEAAPEGRESETLPPVQELPGIPSVPSGVEPPMPPEPPAPPAAADSLRHAGHAGHATRVQVKIRNGDIGAMIERSIEGAMQQVAAGLEAAFTNKEEAQRRMEEVNARIREAMGKLGPRIEEGGRTCVIRGSGTVVGGQRFEEFKCAGSGRVTGDLVADEAHISGACVVEGSCSGKEFHASGRVDIAKDVAVQEFHVSGKANIGGDVRAQEVSVSGSARIGGAVLDAQDVSFAGAVQIGGGVKTQSFTSRGEFQIGGTIEAEDVDIRLVGTSKVPSIKAQEIEIRRGERKGELTAETIEGEEVYLEATRAGLVRGHSVRLGPYCSVHTVEAEDLEVHETSTFKERRAPSRA